MLSSDYQVLPTKYMGDIGKNMVKADFTEDSFSIPPFSSPKIIRQEWWSDPTNYTNNITLSDPNTTLPKLFMFHDSFAGALEPFMFDQFSRQVWVTYPFDNRYY